MAIKITYYSSVVKLHDTLTINGLPATGTQVSIINKRTNKQVCSATVNSNTGFYSIVVPKTTLVPGIYFVKYFGRGFKSGFQPEGSWETIEIRDSSLNISAYLSSYPGNLVKYDTTYTPLNIVLTANTSNIYNIGYKWYKGDTLLSGEESSTYEVDCSNDLSSVSSQNYVCVISGTNIDGEAIEDVTASINVVKVVDGDVGAIAPSIVFRGIYNETKTYYSTETRKDVVKYETLYYICNTNETTGVWNATYWDSFGSSFDSVATGLLLTEDAVIARSLTLGTDGDMLSTGLIKSALVEGNLVGNGFLLSATENGSGIFRVGSVLSNALTKGIYWNGNDLIVKASHFEIDSDGLLWADSGGFGGASGTPKVLINSSGLQTGETYLHGNSSWTAPTDVILSGSDSTNAWIKSAGVTIPGLGELIYTSDFSAGVNGWTANNGVVAGNQDNIVNYNNTLLYSSNGSFTNKEHYAQKSTLGLTSGTSYTISFWYYIPAGQTIVVQGRVVVGSSLASTGVDFTTTGAWTYITVELTATNTDDPIRIYACNATKTAYYGNGSNVLYIYGLTVNMTDAQNTTEFNITDTNSYITYEYTVASEEVNKVFSFSTYIEGDGGANNIRHKYQVITYFDSIIVSTRTFYKTNNTPASPISVSFYPTSAGLLKFKLVYLGTESVVTDLPNVID